MFTYKLLVSNGAYEFRTQVSYEFEPSEKRLAYIAKAFTQFVYNVLDFDELEMSENPDIITPDQLEESAHYWFDQTWLFQIGVIAE